MTPRERLFNALDGQGTDHVPVWLLFPYHPLGCYVDVRQLPAYRPVYEMSKQCAFMLNRRNLRAGTRLWGEGVKSRSETIQVNGQNVSKNLLEFSGKQLSGWRMPANSCEGGKKLLNSEEDLEILASFPINDDPQAIQTTLDQNLETHRRETAEFPTDYGAMMLDLGEPINFLYQNSNLEEFSIWSLTHDHTIVSLLEKFMSRQRLIYRYCLEHDLADIYFMVGSELAAPPLVSRETFQRWIVPYAKELIDLIHSYGKKVIQHFHGQIKEILPDFVAMGADALHTIEAPPVGNCSFAEAFETVGDSMTLIGNIQYDDFRSFSTEKMAQAVRDILEECHGKRLILSPSAGPFDPEAPPQMIRNYQTFMQTAWDYGEWTRP